MSASGQLGFLVPRPGEGRWRESANCRLTSPEKFFAAGDSDAAADAVKEAKALCRTCTVREACLQFALETKQVDGIWGGTTEDERRRLRRAWVTARRLRAG